MNLHSIAQALGGEVTGGQVLAPGPNHSKADRSMTVKLSPGAPDGFIVFSHAGDNPLACKDYVRSKIGAEPFRPQARPDPISNMRARSNGQARPEPAPEEAPQAGPRRLVATYDYLDEAGELLKQAMRYEPKDFRQRRPDPNRPGAWIYSVAGVRNVPYRLLGLLASSSAPVFITEGEKDADRLAGHGITATTNIGGAGKWTDDLNPHFAGRIVFILADNDQAGADHVVKVATHLAPIAAEVRTINLPNLPPKGDVSNWLDAGGDADELPALCASFPLFGEEETPRHANGNHHDPAGSTSTWQAPKPLPSGLAPVVAFDAAMIPDAIGPWVSDISDRMQCPPDFVAVSAMVGLAAVLGRKVAIHPQNKTDWIEVPNLWGVIVGRPGAMKSPAMGEAMKPLNRLEGEARLANEEEAKRYASALAIHKLRTEESQKTARAALKANSRADVSGMIDIEEPEKPKPRRYVTNDSSYEALGEILAANPNGVLTFRDELVSLLKTLDRDENTAARGFFLTAWNGKDGYTFDRIVRGLTHIDAACVSLLGSTQPGRLADYLSRAVKGSAGDDGLIQRFSLLVWPDDNSQWKEVDRYPDSDARKAAWDTFTRLDQLSPESVGAERSEFDKLPHLRIGPAGQELFSEWRCSLESRLRAGNLHASVESHFAKYRKLIPSLALINHLADGGTGPIGKAAMLKALAFGEYLETHAMRAYGSGLQAEASTARAIQARIQKGDITGEFTARDILQRDWSNLSDKDQVTAGLELLDDLHWVASRKVDTGGRPKIVFTVNPRAMA